MLYLSICILECCLTLLLVLHFPVLQAFLNDSKPVLPPCSKKIQIYNIISFDRIRKSTFWTHYSSLSMLTFNSTHCLAALSFEVPNASLCRGLASESTIMTIFLQRFYPQTPFSIMLFSRTCNFLPTCESESTGSCVHLTLNLLVFFVSIIFCTGYRTISFRSNSPLTEIFLIHQVETVF